MPPLNFDNCWHSLKSRPVIHFYEGFCWLVMGIKFYLQVEGRPPESIVTLNTLASAVGLPRCSCTLWLAHWMYWPVSIDSQTFSTFTVHSPWFYCITWLFNHICKSLCSWTPLFLGERKQDVCCGIIGIWLTCKILLCSYASLGVGLVQIRLQILFLSVVDICSKG